MKNKVTKFAITALVLVFSFALIQSALATSTPQSIVDNTTNDYKYGTYDVNDAVIFVIRASRWVLGLVGSLALLMFVYGGLLFLISGGSSDQVGKAKKVIIAAVIGLAIVFASYLIIQYVLSILGISWDGKIPA
ncbi:MAG: hypothetical protein ACM3PZ_00170 [Bacillota bacterium]